MRLMRRLRIWAGSVALRRNIAIALAMAALASGIATYLALTESPPFGPDPSAVLSLLNLDLVLLLELNVRTGRECLPLEGAGVWGPFYEPA